MVNIVLESSNVFTDGKWIPGCLFNTKELDCRTQGLAPPHREGHLYVDQGSPRYVIGEEGEERKEQREDSGGSYPFYLRETKEQEGSMGAPAGKTKGPGPARTTRARTGCESLWRPCMPPKEASRWEEDRYTKYQGLPTRRYCLRSRARPARLSKLMSYWQTPVALTNNRMNQRAEILLCPGGRPKASFKATTKFNMGGEKNTRVCRPAIPCGI